MINTIRYINTLSGLVVQRVGLQIYNLAGSNPGQAQLHNDSMQVVHNHVPLSSSSISWYYGPNGGDILRLER